MQLSGYTQWLPVFCLISFPGCATRVETKNLSDQIFNLYTRVLDLDARLARSQETVLPKQTATLTSRIEGFSTDLSSLKGSVDVLREGVRTGQLPDEPPSEDSVGVKLRKLDKRLFDLEARHAEVLDLLQNQLHSGADKQKSGAAKPSLKKKLEFAKALKNKRFKDIIASAPSAIAGKKSSRDVLEIRFFEAESYFQLGKLEEAALIFNEVVENKLVGRLKPAVQARLGDCFQGLGDSQGALVFYRDLIKEFPKSPEASRASRQISRLESQKARDSRS